MYENQSLGPPETNIKSGGYLPTSNLRMWEAEMGNFWSKLPCQTSCPENSGFCERPPLLLYKVNDQENQPGPALGPHTCTCELHICEHAYTHRRHTYGKSASFVHSTETCFLVFNSIFIYFVCVHTHACHSTRIEVGDSSRKSVLSFYYMGPRN